MLGGQDVRTASTNGSAEAADPRMPTCNAAMGKAQMAWPRGRLELARHRHEMALPFCHHPALAASSSASLIPWNVDQVCRVLEATGCVVAYVSGHDLRGGYTLHGGVRDPTIPGIVEAPAGGNASALFEVYGNQISAKGFGVVKDRDMVFGRP